MLHDLTHPYPTRPTSELVNKPTPPHNYELTWDGTRDVAFGYGDDNPLWGDRNYGEKTRWSGLIAPPNFLYTMGESDAPPITNEVKPMIKGDALAGPGSYQAQIEYELWRPLRFVHQRKQRYSLSSSHTNTKICLQRTTGTKWNDVIKTN